MLEFFAVFGKNALLVVGALLPIMNPVGGAPIFLSLTEGAPREVQNFLARRIAANCFAVLAGAMFLGSFVLDFFGLSVPIVRVAGGLLVTATAWRLLQADEREAEIVAPSPATAWTTEQALRKAFYPLSFPMVVGPGSIATAITLGAAIYGSGREALPVSAAALLGLAVVSLTVFLCFRFAHGLVERLGTTGTLVLLRLSAFILLCIGVQIFWTGAEELLAPWRRDI